MNSKEIEELRKEVYEMSNSMLPLVMFFNDIRDNKSPTFNKELAYKDLREIVERFKELKKVNVVLHTRIHKLEEQNKALKSDNTALEIWNDVYSADWNKVKERNEKLEKTIEFLKNVLGLSLDKNKIMFWVVTKRKYDSNNYDYARITKEEYDLLKEVLQDD